MKMTREEIKNTPELVDFMLDKCILADSRIKVHKRLEEVCDLATEALEQELILDKIRAEIKAKLEEEEFARSVFRHEEQDTAKAEQCTGSIMAYKSMIKLIDKYKSES